MAEAPRLPDYVSAPVVRSVAGRPTAARINAAASTARTRSLAVAAAGALVPIIYGRCNVPALVGPIGKIGADLVITYIWGIGEIDAVEQVLINDQDAAGIAGVTLTHYLGTPTQGVDPTLVAAIPAYNDTLRFEGAAGWRGIAYTVARITDTAAVGGAPRARATLRGRKLYDPRGPATAYSENPALVLADLLSDPDYGLGATVIDADAAADWCDTLLGGASPRARIALTLADGRPAEDWAILIAEYAETLFVYEGADIRLIPDGPVDLSAAPRLRAADIVRDSLTLQALDDSSDPSEIELVYTLPATGATPWGSERITVVDADAARRIPSSVSLEGVYRAEEANAKAQARLARLKHRVEIALTTTDSGVVRQAGDVVVIEHPERGIDIPARITQVAYAGPGRYTIRGRRYDAAHYPSDLVLPGENGTIPDQAIALWGGSVVPGDWEIWSAADGRYLMGAGGSHAPGATGGSNDTAAWSGTTSTDGAHSASADMRCMAAQPSTEIPTSKKHGSHLTGSYGDHPHDWSAPAGAMNLKRREQPLVRKVGAGVLVPAGVWVFGLAGLSHPDIQRLTAHAGRLVSAASAAASAGTTSQSLSATISSASMPHDHVLDNAYYKNDFAPFEDARAYYNATSFLHSHTLTVSLVADVQRRGLALYGGIADYPVIPGMILLSAGAPPTDWVLCDGSAGSPDMRDYLVEIAGTGDEGVAAGDNTVTASGTSGSYGHNHDGGDDSDGPVLSSQGHKGTVYHNHQVSESQPFVPPWYAVNFIMYAPGQ